MYGVNIRVVTFRVIYSVDRPRVHNLGKPIVQRAHNLQRHLEAASYTRRHQGHVLWPLGPCTTLREPIGDFTQPILTFRTLPRCLGQVVAQHRRGICRRDRSQPIRRQVALKAITHRVSQRDGWVTRGEM